MKFKFLDRERELKYTFRDMLKIREQYAGRDFELVDVPHLVSLGLRREDPEITPERVSEIVDMETFDSLCDTVRKAAGFEKRGEARPTAESLGNSGPSGDTSSSSPMTNSGLLQ